MLIHIEFKYYQNELNMYKGFIYTPFFYIVLLVLDLGFDNLVIIHTIVLQALLSGFSAGGLASIIHCDEFRDLFPTTTEVKCPSDAGFFFDA